MFAAFAREEPEPVPNERPISRDNDDIDRSPYFAKIKDLPPLVTEDGSEGSRMVDEVASLFSPSRRIVVNSTRPAPTNETRKKGESQILGNSEMFDFDIDLDDLRSGAAETQTSLIFDGNDGLRADDGVVYQFGHSAVPSARQLLFDVNSIASASSGDFLHQAKLEDDPRQRTKHWTLALAVALFVVTFFVVSLFPQPSCAVTQAPNVPLITVLIVDCGLLQVIASAFRRHVR
jgi:hypothetical protein